MATAPSQAFLSAAGVQYRPFPYCPESGCTYADGMIRCPFVRRPHSSVLVDSFVAVVIR